MTAQEELAKKAREGGIGVSVVPDGPDRALDMVIRSFLAERGRQVETQSEDHVNRGVVSRSKRRSRLFDFSVKLDCDDYADLMHKIDMGLAIERRKKDLTDGIKFALFIEWMELEKEVEEVRAEAAGLADKVLGAIQAKREGANAAKKEKRKRTKKERAPPVVVEMDELPPTHR